MRKLVNIYTDYPILTIKYPIAGNTMHTMLPVGDILNCICGKALVDEILEDGTVVRLNLQNYNRDNSYLVKTKKQIEIKKFEDLKIDPIIEDVEIHEEIVEDESLDKQIDEVIQDKKEKFEQRKNKHNKK